jgi:hypothetical protein
MAASAFQSTTVELARITAASPTGIKAGTDGDPSLPEIGTAQRTSKLSLIGIIRAGHDSLRSGPTLNEE